MKDLKKKLTAAAAMLVVSAVMLSGVSYAWYTLSTNPEVSNIKANIVANENLEIALDNGYENEAAVDAASVVSTNGPQGSTTGNPYTWGNLVDLDVAMATLNPTETATKENPQLTLAPVKWNATKLQFPKYGTDGRVASTDNDLVAQLISDKTDVQMSTAEGVKGVQAWKQTADATVADAFSITYWLRSNENSNVTLSEAAKRAGSEDDKNAAVSDVNGVMGSGSYIEIPVKGENNAAKVESYVKNLVVQFNVDGVDDPIYAKLTKTTESATDVVRFNLKLDSKKNSSTDTSAANIQLTANTAKKITTYVYIDGETVTNADALLDDISGMTMNLQFQNSTTTTPGAMNGTTAAAPSGN